MQATGSKTSRPQSLSIRLHAGGFSFYVCDAQRGALIRGEHFFLNEGERVAEHLRTVLNATTYCNAQTESVLLMSCAPSTRVPLEEFHREEAALLYRHTFSDTSLQDNVLYNILPQLESVELFALPAGVEEVLTEFFPNVRYYGSQSMLQEHLLRFHADADTVARRLYCCCCPEAIHAYSFRNSHLTYGNRFDIEGSNAPFFLLSAWKQLGYDVERDELLLLATEENESLTALQQELCRFVHHVSIVLPKDFFPNTPLRREKEIPLDLMALLAK